MYLSMQYSQFSGFVPGGTHCLYVLTKIIEWLAVKFSQAT